MICFSFDLAALKVNDLKDHVSDLVVVKGSSRQICENKINLEKNGQLKSIFESR